MTSFVSIQNTYQEIQIALWRDSVFTGSISIDKIKASPDLIPTLAQLLKNHDLTLADLDFIGVNQGPGPFTTLRVVIASVNGISFATQLPLIGVDGIEALLTEQQNPAHPQTVALLNAFSNDVYFGIQQNGVTTAKGYDNITQFLTTINQQLPTGTIRFIGNGTTLYQTEINGIIGDRAFIPQPMVENVSINTIGDLALKAWGAQQDITYQVLPLYLKEFKLGAK